MMAETETHDSDLALARDLDARDELRNIRDEFYFPRQDDGEPILYFVGNSLGLQPKRTQSYVQEELEKWKDLAVRGHFECEYPWMHYHEFLTETMADLVGAQPNEVVMMNSLTTNLHLMMATFYRPTRERHKVLIEHQAFPSDYQAVISQMQWHGLDPDSSLIVARSTDGSGVISEETILKIIEQHGSELALVLLPGVQYYTGQVFSNRIHH